MKIIKREHKVEPFKLKILDQYMPNMKLCVFDIETLGLNSAYIPMILAGLLTVDSEGNAVATQYFAEVPEEEILILEHLRQDFEKADFLLTYNGKHFDLPFVEKRASVLGLEPLPLSLSNLDLYLVLNGHSDIKQHIPNLKQKTVEIYMGLAESRDDLISGAESIELYNAFLNTPEGAEKEALMEKILLHNHDDLLQLYKLLPILKKVDSHKAFNTLGFPVKGNNGWPNVNVRLCKVVGKEFVIEGKYIGEAFNYQSFDAFMDCFTCNFNEDGTFFFKIPVIKHKGNFFINMLDFHGDYASLEKYPGYLNDFLLVSQGNKCQYLEANMFTQKFLFNFMDSHVCPLMTL